MLVFVKTFGGRKFGLDIDSFEDTVVGTLKARLETIEGTPMEQQSLIFEDISLEDHNTLAHYGIRRYSVIDYKLKVQINHRLYVKTIHDGKTLTLEVDSLNTINDVKLMIQERLAIPIARQSLWMNQICFDHVDDEVLAMHNIYSGATLQVYPIPQF